MSDSIDIFSAFRPKESVDNESTENPFQVNFNKVFL
jgi:hypothetical protein